MEDKLPETYDATIDDLFDALISLRRARAAATSTRGEMQKAGHTWLVPACEEKIAEIDELIARVRAVIECDKSEAGDYPADRFAGLAGL